MNLSFSRWLKTCISHCMIAYNLGVLFKFVQSIQRNLITGLFPSG